MPSRWWVPVPGIRPEFVKIEHVHAAVSRWFDTSPAEHNAREKPYAISPLADGDHGGSPGIEVATFTREAEDRLRAATKTGCRIRLGNQLRSPMRPQPMHQAAWSELAAGPHEQWWELTFVTPATFRSGDRATPLPDVRTILTGLARVWTSWSDIPLSGLHHAVERTYATDVDLLSTVLHLTIPKRRTPGSHAPLTVPGTTGTLRLRCPDAEAAAAGAPLFRFAAYSGVGSMTRRGLGVTRTRSIPQ